MTPEPGAASSPQEVPSSAPCARCGTFVVAGQERRSLGRAFCGACAARPEVAEVEAFRARQLGRRTLAVWLVGMIALASLWIAYEETRRALPKGAWRPWAGVALDVLVAVGAAAYFARRRWARPALFLIPFVPAAGFAETESGVTAGVLYALAVVAAALLVFLYRSVRQRLFFRLEVDAGQLDRAWRRSAPNPMARVAAWAALGTTVALGVVLVASDPVIAATDGRAEEYVWLSVALLLVIAFATAVVGLAALLRYRPSATPPVGGLPSSLTAIGLGVGWLLIAVAAFTA